MRCEGCDGKFGANGEPDVEVDTEDCSETTAIADCTVNVTCANCGGDFKTGNITVEADFADLADDHDPHCEEDDDRFFEVVGTSAEVSDAYRPTTRQLKNGQTRPVPMRFRRHEYDVEVVFEVRCSKCETTFEVRGTETLGAGELDAA